LQPKKILFCPVYAGCKDRGEKPLKGRKKGGALRFRFALSCLSRHIAERKRKRRGREGLAPGAFPDLSSLFCEHHRVRKVVAQISTRERDPEKKEEKKEKKKRRRERERAESYHFLLLSVAPFGTQERGGGGPYPSRGRGGRRKRRRK